MKKFANNSKLMSSDAPLICALIALLMCSCAFAEPGQARPPSPDPRSPLSPVETPPDADADAGRPLSVEEYFALPAQVVSLPDADIYDRFGYSLALSADGGTLAVGVPLESSRIPRSTTRPDTAVASTGASGAVVIYTRSSDQWIEQARLKPAGGGAGDRFGYSVSLNDDGSILAVGAPFEDGSPRRADSEFAGHNNDMPDSGAVYVFARSDQGRWSKLAYLKDAEAQKDDALGSTLALDGAGRVLAVGYGEFNDSKSICTFIRSGAVWQQTDIPADGVAVQEGAANPVALNASGSLLAAGVPVQNTVRIYVMSAKGWRLSDQLTVPVFRGGRVHSLGMSVSFDGGNQLAATAYEDILLSQKNEESPVIQSFSPVIVIFEHIKGGWQVQAKLRLAPSMAKNTVPGFLYTLQMSRDGDSVVAGGYGDDELDSKHGNGIADGVTATPAGSSQQKKAAIGIRSLTAPEETIQHFIANYGAVWLASRLDGVWQTPVRIQAPQPETGDRFGRSVAIDATGHTLATGAPRRDVPLENRPALLSFDDDITDGGAVFIYSRPDPDLRISSPRQK